MSHKARPNRDPFAFSLAGLSAIASVVPVPIVDAARLNRECGERHRARQARERRSDA